MPFTIGVSVVVVLFLVTASLVADMVECPRRKEMKSVSQSYQYNVVININHKLRKGSISLL